MKVKLLKKLRRKFALLFRNNEYKVYDEFNESYWTDYENARIIRRGKILTYAQYYKTHKKIIQ